VCGRCLGISFFFHLIIWIKQYKLIFNIVHSF
jgi:hypothetical protein